jgi:predicted membrane GTPase involved in stress response
LLHKLIPEKHYKQKNLKMGMSAKEFDVNGTDYKIVITEQVIGHVNNLKDLYNAAYEDPESFDDVSTEISSTINEIASTVEPPAEDSDLDGLIQEIIKAVDTKADQIEKELQAKPKATKKSKSKK